MRTQPAATDLLNSKYLQNRYNNPPVNNHSKHLLKETKKQKSKNSGDMKKNINISIDPAVFHGGFFLTKTVVVFFFFYLFSNIRRKLKQSIK